MQRKKETPETIIKFGPWKLVFDTQEELDKSMCKFSEDVHEDIQTLAEARRKSELLAFRDALGLND